MFTYSGWNAAAYMAEEIRDPGRNVPRALLLGTIARHHHLRAAEPAVSVRDAGRRACRRCKGSVLDVIGERLLGARAGDIMGVVAIISLAASINAWTFAGPRVYYAMARDGVFFPAAAKVHPKFKTPHVSIIAQALWASVLILTGSLDALTNYVGFAIILFAGIAVAALFVLRAREPNAPRPYKTLGYPVAPAIFVLACLAIVVNAIYQPSRADRPRPARHGRRHPAVRVADTPAALTRRRGSRFRFQVPRSRWARECCARLF